VLRLGAPPGVFAAATVTAFAERTGVRVEAEAYDSEAEALLRVAAGGDTPPFDALLVGSDTLRELVAADAVEPLAGPLIPNRRLVTPPWDDPLFDRGGDHSVPHTYETLGYALAPGVDTDPSDTWRGFFALAETRPGDVAVPPEPAAVVGAALSSAGRPWNSTDAGDLAAARQVLVAAAAALRVEGELDRTTVGRRAAVLALSRGFVRADERGVRFAVPLDGTVAPTLVWCIPVYARSPVSAHAWLDHVLDPAVAADNVRASGRGSPVAAAAYLLPTALVADPAVFAPVDALPALTFEALSEDAHEMRRTVWAEVFAGVPAGTM
jgi:spermidine/putrescine transport system substrate-binding protein